MLLPPVRGAIDRRRDLAGTALFVAGTVTGGLVAAALLFVVAGLTGALPPLVRAMLLTAAVGYLAAVELGRAPGRLGGRREPIPQQRFRWSMLRGQFAFGAELGLGFRTRITHMGPHLLVAMLLLVRDEADGAAALCDLLDCPQSPDMVRALLVPALRAGVAERRGGLDEDADPSAMRAWKPMAR